MEVPLSADRLVLFVSLLTIPAFAQQPTLTPQMPGRNWSLGPVVRPEPLRESDLRAVRIQTIRDDIQQLSALNATLQSDLQELQKGVLPRNFSESLKKMEKLSKKLRQEIGQQ